MNMISTGAFLTEVDIPKKENTLFEEDGFCLGEEKHKSSARAAFR